MLALVFAIFYLDISITYKIGIAMLVLSVIFLTTMATQILSQQKENKKA